MKEINVPIFVAMHAGLVGTNLWDVVVVSMTEEDLQAVLAGDEYIEDVADLEFLDDMLADHAESYGVYRTEDGYVCEGSFDEEDTFEVTPEISVEGIYVPEEFDMYKSGGGSFLEVEEVATAYEALKDVEVFRKYFDLK